MSERTLHLMSPARFDNIAAIVGDRQGLEELRHAVDMALSCGSGGVFVFASDGEGYALAVALETDMQSVHTSYAGEAYPLRSLREITPLRAVKNFRPALLKALSHAPAATVPAHRTAVRPAIPQPGSAAPEAAPCN
ncbi:MAG: hypothetical protein PHR35_11570 [Kiritimatiellae bacterium]|nr:hypothetical protein [Kiritimatiellia bacterium]